MLTSLHFLFFITLSNFVVGFCQVGSRLFWVRVDDEVLLSFNLLLLLHHSTLDLYRRVWLHFDLKLGDLDSLVRNESGKLGRGLLPLLMIIYSLHNRDAVFLLFSLYLTKADNLL